jgi:hypothetical protein
MVRELLGSPPQRDDRVFYFAAYRVSGKLGRAVPGSAAGVFLRLAPEHNGHPAGQTEPLVRAEHRR